MVSLGHVALDGTKVQANASKHKAMSHERMLRAEKELEKEINALSRRPGPEPQPPANPKHQQLSRPSSIKKAETAEAKAKAAREKAIEAAQDAGLEAPDL